MDAKAHNECAKHFIQAIVLLNRYIDEPIEIEVFASNEGGVKDLYKIVIKNPLFLIIITALITSTINQFFTSNFSPSVNHTEETKNKLDNLLKIKEAVKTGTLTSEEFDYIAENDKDLKKLKSNFFRAAKKEKRIDSIEIEAIKREGQKVCDKVTIPSTDFEKCILPAELKSTETETDAKIHIVAPVLIRGRKDYWKGIFNGEPIEFRVSDKNFLENVYQHIVKFSNGTYINCNMTITKTVSTIDDSEKLNRNVFNVIGYGDDEDFRTIYKRRNRADATTFNNSSTPSLFAEIK
jgi:hypothetical protein